MDDDCLIDDAAHLSEGGSGIVCWVVVISVISVIIVISIGIIVYHGLYTSPLTAYIPIRTRIYTLRPKKIQIASITT